VKIILFIAALGMVLGSHAATNQVACTDAAIRAAIAAVAEGDVVEILPGSCTITNQITSPLYKSFWLRGSGTNQTTITSGNFKYTFLFQNSETNVITVSDMTCIGSSGNNGGFFSYGHTHYYNLHLTTPYRGITTSKGLVERCVFVNTGVSAQPIDFEGGDYTSWASEVIPFGTTNAAYAENCVFYANGYPGNGFFDAYNGASLVFRHNFCDGYTPSGVHGYDSGDTSARSWEIYNNVFTNCGGGPWVLGFRGGSGVLFSNTVYATTAGFAQLKYYRSCPPAHLYVGVPLPRGVPGYAFTINYTNYDWGTTGLGLSFDGNPTNWSSFTVGFTTYRYTNNVPDGGSISGYGGGYIRIGSSVAETITNTFNAINLGPGAGTAYSSGTTIGHDFIAIGMTDTDLILTNALDSNTDQYGWPANQQPGVISSYALTGTNFSNNQTLWPCYFWSNTVNGAAVDVGLADNTEQCSYYITNLVKAGRDYFNARIPEPSHYTPLVYPHPLAYRDRTVTTKRVRATTLRVGILR